MLTGPLCAACCSGHRTQRAGAVQESIRCAVVLLAAVEAECISGQYRPILFDN